MFFLLSGAGVSSSSSINSEYYKDFRLVAKFDIFLVKVDLFLFLFFFSNSGSIQKYSSTFSELTK